MPDVGGNAPLRGRMQALVMPEEITVWDGASSGHAVVEQNPRPGIPVADQDSHLVMVSSGTPTGTENAEFRVQHGGLPGQVDHGCAIATRRTGDALWMGWDQPGILSGFEVPNFNPSPNDDEEPSIVSLVDGTLIMAARNGSNVTIYTKAAGNLVWTTQASIVGVSCYFPALVVAGSEVFLLVWREGSEGTKYYIGAWRALDSALNTWTEVQNAATLEDDVESPTTVTVAPTITTYSAGRIRAAYRDGQFIVLAALRKHGPNIEQDHIRQYAGASLAARLDTIGTYQGSGAGWNMPDVVATPDGFAAAWLARAQRPRFALLGSAWQPISAADLGQIAPASSPTAASYDFGEGDGWDNPSGSTYTLQLDGIGELALAYDPAGVIWMYVASAAASVMGAGVQVAFYSPDGGTTWATGHTSHPSTTDISGYWWYPEDMPVSPGTQGNYPIQLAACWSRGQVCIAHGWSAAVDSDSLAGNTVAVAYLGGMTDLTIPRERNGVRVGDRVGWLRTVLPYERPENQDYTATQAGTQTSTIATPGRHRFTTGDGAGATGQNYYSFTGVDNGDEQHGGGCVMINAASVEAGGDTSAKVGFRMRLASTNHGVELEVTRTTTGVYVRDFVAGTALGSATGIPGDSDVWIKWGMQITSDTGAGRSVQVWWRRENGSTVHKQQWTRIGSYTLTDDAGAGGTAPKLTWGNIISSGATTQNDGYWLGPWFFMPYAASGSVVGTDGLWHDLDQAGGDNPDKLAGRPLGTAQVWAIDGWTIGGRRGPGWIGETWSSAVRGEYEVGRAHDLNVPSYRVHLRTTDDNADTVIPWAADPDRPDAEDTEHEPHVALHIWTNCRQVKLESKAAGGAWTTRATIDMRVISAASYTRKGRIVRASATGNTTYLIADEVDADWTVEFDNGAGTTRYRHPVGNSEGRWSSATSEPRARIDLGTTEAGDPVSGGTLSLWSPIATVIVQGVDCTAWRVVADSTHPTADGDHRLKFFFGPAHLITFPPSWSRSISYEPGHDRVMLEGDVGVNVDRSPVAEIIRLAWDTSVDETQIREASATLSTVIADTGGGEPGGAVAAMIDSLVRALRRHKGRPVVWCTWDRAAPGPITILRPHEQLLATIEAPPDVEVDLGEVGNTETKRAGSLRLRGEL